MSYKELLNYFPKDIMNIILDYSFNFNIVIKQILVRGFCLGEIRKIIDDDIFPYINENLIELFHCVGVKDPSINYSLYSYYWSQYDVQIKENKKINGLKEKYIPQYMYSSYVKYPKII